MRQLVWIFSKLRVVPVRDAVRRFTLQLVVALLCASAALGADLQVGAAASLSDVLRELAATFERNTGAKVHLNFGGSNVVARQIEEGAPADVFVSADELRMNELAARGLVDGPSRRNLLGNSLTVVVPRTSTLGLRRPGDLTRSDVRRIALPNTSAVPAGIYARQALISMALWGGVQDKIIQTENVRAALAAVAAGNADCAIVYRTDALIEPRVMSAFEITGRAAPRIVYPAAALRTSRNLTLARRFVDFLASPFAAHVFRRYGFEVLTGTR